MMECRIPVQNDQISLEGRLYRAKKGSTPSKRWAVISHPYPYLGGSMHDRVVQSVAERFLAQGISVLLYNSRGTERSGGSASWTGEPERHDFALVVNWLIKNQVDQVNSVIDLPDSTESGYTIYCCGYSFGALAASACPALSSLRRDPFDYRYLLISPPMGFTSMFLIPFRFGTYVQAMKATLTQQYHAQGEKSKVLLLYGDRDQFTAEADYTNYIKKVTSDTAASLRVKKVPRGDHFFSSKEAFQSMCNTIDDWI